MNNKVGISLYLQNTIDKNERILKRALESNISIVFTSLNIPEENSENMYKDLEKLSKICVDNKCDLFVDVNQFTCSTMGIKELKELKKIGITHLRLDDGFSFKDMEELSNDFYIVLNASTIDECLLNGIKDMDRSKFIACHNYYPKKYTGLSIKKVRSDNQLLHELGLKVISFVSCNKERRGPLYEGLPTIEEQRDKILIESIWQTKKEVKSDIIMIGDVECSEEELKVMKDYSENKVVLKYTSFNADIDLESLDFHDRKDSSEFLMRFVESRELFGKLLIEPNNCIQRKVGSICISNNKYGRYKGELEILRTQLESDDRVNVIGQLDQEFIRLLQFIPTETIVNFKKE